MTDLGYTLIILTKQLKIALNRALAAHDVTITQWALIAGLHRNGPQTAAVLGAAVEMDKPTVSAVVQRLLAKDLITRKPKPGDMRAKVLTLTAAGEDAYVACAAIADAVVDDFLAPLAPAERAQLMALLTTLDRGAAHD